MSDEIRNLMHEKLDGVLSEELSEELFQHLSKDEQAAEEYARLESLDRLLSSAPPVRAPQRLAVTIMARLAKNIEMQAQLNKMPHEVRQLVMQSIMLSMVTMMPMMVGASWMVLNASANPIVLTRVMERMLGLMQVVIDAQLIILDEVQPYLTENPTLAAQILQLMPTMMISLLDHLKDKNDYNGEL
jgi:hypothetical protein